MSEESGLYVIVLSGAQLLVFKPLPHPLAHPGGLPGIGEGPIHTSQCANVGVSGRSGENTILCLTAGPRWPWFLSVGTDRMTRFFHTHEGD